MGTGVGNPFPLVLVSLPYDMVSFGGGQELLAEAAMLEQTHPETADGLNGWRLTAPHPVGVGKVCEWRAVELWRLW